MAPIAARQSLNKMFHKARMFSATLSTQFWLIVILLIKKYLDYMKPEVPSEYWQASSVGTYREPVVPKFDTEHFNVLVTL
jgi:hypothetical protein